MKAVTNYSNLQRYLSRQGFIFNLCKLALIYINQYFILIVCKVDLETYKSSSFLSPTIFSKLKNNLKYNYFRFVDKIKTAQSIINPPSIS